MRIFSIILLLALLTACEKNETGPRPVPGDYFPTKAGLEWHYLATWRGTPSTAVPVQTIAGDTLVGNQTYTKVRTAANLTTDPSDTTYTYSLVRKENGNYFEIKINEWSSVPAGTEERIFLKDYAGVGTQWTYRQAAPANPEEEVETLIVKIKAIDKERKIGGNTFFNTIEVQENTYLKSLKHNSGRLFFSRHAVYAKDRGLVHETREYFDYPAYGEKTLKTGPF